MYKTRLIRIVCLALCLAMVFSLSTTTVIALDSSSYTGEANYDNEDVVIIDPLREDEDIDSSIIDESNLLKPGDLTFEELKKLSVDIQGLPEFIDEKTAMSKGHVNRLYQQEKSLNTVVYQNQNGTKSTYIFSRPVKYIDENGTVHDKSSKISVATESNNVYAVLDNSIKIYFSDSENAGALIYYKDFEISMFPNTAERSSLKYDSENNTIEYVNAFGDGTSVLYHPKLNGLKEDIVLLEKTDNNRFCFKLALTGLTPIKENENWYLIDGEENVISCFGDIIIRDALGKTVVGSMDIVDTSFQGVYNVTVSVPKEFLEEDTTVYPVYIDPSAYIWEDGYYYDDYGYSTAYNAITDTGLYTTTAAVNLAQNNTDYHKLGYYSSANGKVIYKLYDFFGEHGQYRNLLDCQIGLAYLYFNVNTGSATTVTVNPMTSTWNATTYGDDPIAICNSSLWSSYSSNYSSSLTLDSTSGERAIDITNILRGWARYNAGESTANYDNPANGFVLSSSSTSTYRNITAVEEFYADSVYIIIDTSDTGGCYYINNVISGQFLKRSGTSTLSTTKYSNTNNIRWYFEYLGNDKYIIRSMYNTNYALYGSGSSVSLSYLPSTPTDNYIWDVRIATGGGMIIKNKSNDKVLRYNGSALSLATAMASSDTNYKQTVWGIAARDYYVNLTSFTVTKPEWLAIGSSQYVTIVATPSNATWKTASNFIWTSDNPSVATVDDSGRVTGGAAGYAKITAEHKMTNCKYSYYVTVGQAIAAGTYYILNKDTGRFLDVEGPSTSEGAYIQQWNLHNGNQEKWVLSYYGDGYYYIKSVYSNKYVSVYNSSNAAGAVIHQVTVQSDANRWKIIKTVSGAYKLISKCGESNSRCLGLPSLGNYNGLNCIQATYTNDSDYRDEWAITEMSDIFSSYRVPSKTFTIQCIGSLAQGTTWYPLIQTSADSWNTTVSSNITVSSSISSPYTCEVDSYTEGWFGLTTSYISGGKTVQAEIQINSSTCDSGDNPRKSTITHEIGHLWGLADNPPVYSDRSLMSHGRNRNSIYAPQTFDIFNVKYIYNN